VKKGNAFKKFSNFAHINTRFELPYVNKVLCLRSIILLLKLIKWKPFTASARTPTYLAIVSRTSAHYKTYSQLNVCMFHESTNTNSQAIDVMDLCNMCIVIVYLCVINVLMNYSKDFSKISCLFWTFTSICHKLESYTNRYDSTSSSKQLKHI